MAHHSSYKLAILNNLITPYRLPIYQGLSKSFSTYLLLSGEESNRDMWKDLDKELVGVRVRKVWGFTLQFFEKRSGQVFDPRYLHINPGYLWELLRIQPDVLISTEMGFRSLIALLYGFILSKPVWILWGGTLLTERKRSRLKQMIRQLVFKRVTRWISYGETTTEYLLHLGISRSHILQIKNCVDERLYTSCDRPPTLTLSPSPVLLYAGQLIKRKGVDLLLKAAKKLQEEGHQFSILMVGSGVEEENLMQLISQLELKNITVLPSQSPADMPAIYKSADVLVFPTLEDVWGLVVNEALWSGLPVISSIYAGCAKEILPSNNLFDPLEQDSTLDALRKAVNGELSPADPSQLYTCAQVINMISAEINNSLTSVQRLKQSVSE